MKTKATILAIFILLGLTLAAQGQPWSGSGTEGDPYLIEDANDMQAIGADPNYWGAHFELVNDINLAQFTGTQFNIIGNDSNAFTGVFDGNGHTISKFTYYTTNYEDFVGLFGYVQAGHARIINLGMIKPQVHTKGNYQGALIGKLIDGTVTGCYVKGGSISGGYYAVGGLVGLQFMGTVYDCYTATAVIGATDVGGLVGDNPFFGAIYNCYSNSDVKGGQFLGGLVGDNHVELYNCYATGDVSVVYGDYGDYIGGLVGRNKGVIDNCYSTGAVEPNSPPWQSSTVYGLYATVTFENSSYDCLQTHTSGASFNDDYAAGYWERTSGGLVGYDVNEVTDSYWDVETSGQIVSAGGTGLTTEQMKTMETFTDAGWDFVEIWNIGESQTYPFLRVCPVGDLNHDFRVDFFDFAIFANHWLEGSIP